MSLASSRPEKLAVSRAALLKQAPCSTTATHSALLPCIMLEALTVTVHVPIAITHAARAVYTNSKVLHATRMPNDEV